MWLDAIFARVCGCPEHGGIPAPAVRPVFTPAEGAAPLLDRKKAVANDLELGDRFDTLMITGPNTGGKTVTLKNHRPADPHGPGVARTSHRGRLHGADL